MLHIAENYTREPDHSDVSARMGPKHSGFRRIKKIFTNYTRSIDKININVIC